MDYNNQISARQADTAAVPADKLLQKIRTTHHLELKVEKTGVTLAHLVKLSQDA